MEEIVINNNGKKNNNLLKVIIIVVASIVGFCIGWFAVDTLLSGDEERTLVCTQKTTESGMDMEMVATVNFVGNDAKEISAVMTVDLGEYIDYKDMFIDTFKEEYKEYTDKGVEVEITSKDTNVIIDIYATKDKIAETSLVSKERYDDVKEELESEGFICK